jgi:hypothetical protein
MSRTWVLLTSSVERRCTGSVFADTRYAIDPLPCPLVADVIATHGAPAPAVHVQSLVVVTPSVLDAPAAGTEPDIAFSTDTSHFTAEGAVTSIEVGPPVQAAARRTAAHAPNSRARIASPHDASALPNRMKRRASAARIAKWLRMPTRRSWKLGILVR